MELLGDHLRNVSTGVQLDSMTFPESNSLDFTRCHAAAMLIIAGSMYMLIKTQCLTTLKENPLRQQGFSSQMSPERFNLRTLVLEEKQITSLCKCILIYWLGIASSGQTLFFSSNTC